MFADPIELEDQQIADFEALYSGTNRPVQERNGRPLALVEIVGPIASEGEDPNAP